MKLLTEMMVVASLGLFGSAIAANGKSEVQACIWLATQPSKPFTVQWKTGQSSDACMKRKGNSKSMEVSQQGITCASLGDVELDDDGWCYWQESHWGLSYNVDGKPYSGSTNSRWTNGPVHSDITLAPDGSPGTFVCGSKSLCSTKAVEWRNDGNEPIYVVFKPGQAAPFSVQDL